MGYDFRNRVVSPSPAIAVLTPSVTLPMYGNGTSSLSPRTSLSGLNNSSSTSPGLGIRVNLKPEYRITPPPLFPPQFDDIPKSIFQFGFDLEIKILAEAEKENPNWNKLVLEHIPSNNTAPTPSSLGSLTNPVISKFIASGLSREAVPFAVAHYGDNPVKVKEFVNGYKILREMGFSSKIVAEALILYDNDPEKSLAHFLNMASS